MSFLDFKTPLCVALFVLTLACNKNEDPLLELEADVPYYPGTDVYFNLESLSPEPSSSYTYSIITQPTSGNSRLLKTITRSIAFQDLHLLYTPNGASNDEAVIGIQHKGKLVGKAKIYFIPISCDFNFSQSYSVKSGSLLSLDAWMSPEKLCLDSNDLSKFANTKERYGVSFSNPPQVITFNFTPEGQPLHVDVLCNPGVNLVGAFSIQYLIFLQIFDYDKYALAYPGSLDIIVN